MRIIKSRRFAMLRERGGHQFVGLELRASMDNVSDQASLEPERVMKKRKKRLHVSCREYYCYKLKVRNSGNCILLHAGRLFQQYVVDMYVKIETARLDYFRNNQKQIRAELYQGIIDSVEIGESRGYKVGRKIILPSSFTGGPRDNKKRYMDAMALVQRYGKPDIFLTVTCNPNWPNRARTKAQ
ncbi:uncharacterized protein LOC111388318 isoform X1 [Olea europaea var. sylvestris]|uniref:Helitron helicase-like domain-containing protein n=1 Tax=Olea europaea subsp. europaea TaxID=158383 RepID=A0A8S0SII1_OLEEU|nr:uncharacterized protein LOC111388318 isoform X1 [Olea europaea var. sylvestris]CAA2992123.1 Hypothetical predicted protein [Olea europaea subsp. europaea]